jgi:AcrR family transcriptional regulator
MDTRETKRETRKQEILAAATAVFAQKGFNGASMDDIVQESGLSKGGVYWHFKSKDDIITAIMGQFFSEEVLVLHQLLDEPGSVGQRLQQLTQQLITDTLQMEAVYLPITLEVYAVAARQETVRQMLQGYFDEYKEGLSALIQQGIGRGEFTAVFPAERTAITLMAQIEGLFLLRAIQGSDFDLAMQAATAVALFLKGLHHA